MKDLEIIIKGCIKNNRGCQEELFKFLSPRLMGVSIRMSPDNDKAHDLLQDAFIKIFASLHNLNNHNPAVVYSWCKRILTNTILDHYRKYKFETDNVMSVDRLRDKPYHDLGLNGSISSGKGVEHGYLAMKNIEPEQIIAAVKTLSPQYKIVFNLFVMEGLSHKEISDHLDISIGTSKSNLSKAKVNLRKELESC
jgi:RNA polymerase sigma-70 factor (ECF subfamily)